MPASEFLDKLAALRADNCAAMPTPELSVMARAVARLRREGYQRKCLQVGETAPDFEFVDRTNQVRRLYELLEDGPVVLNFFRGYWCGYCNTEIEAYEAIQPQLEEMGCHYLALSPQSPDDAPTLPDNYMVIADRDNRIAHQFGIVYQLLEEEKQLFQSWGLDLSKVNKSDQWELPIPATFVICQDRCIGYEYVDVDFRARCCPEQLIEELRAFRTAG